MTDPELKVADDVVVSMEYTLRLDDGEIFDASDGQPLAFIQGRGQIIPGLEQELYGMGEGDEKTVVVAAQDGYGEVDPDAFQVITRNQFPTDIELEEGMGFRLRDKDTGQPVEAYIASIRGDNVELDFNHPLAGEQLFFEVKLVGLRPATAEELAHGHVHGAGGHHH